MEKIDFGPALAYLDEKQDDFRRAEQRQLRFWQREKLESPLLMMSAAELPEVAKSLPDAPYDSAAADPALMLASQLRGALKTAAGNSDAVPSIRPNMGCAILAACVGLEQAFFPDKMPWLSTHLSTDQVMELDPGNIEWKGTFARGLEMLAYFREVLGDRLPIFPMDTQGPFDLAHLLAGDDLFLMLYDDPDTAHHLLDFCTVLIEKAIREMKRVVGEPDRIMHYQNNLYSQSFAIRICEDTAVMLGPDQLDEFVIPYSRRLAEAFGGSYTHYCGRSDELTARLLAEPLFKLINFGQIPGKPELHDFDEEMEKFAAAGKQYSGDWPWLREEKGESYRDYLLRLRHWAEAGILVPFPCQPPPGEFSSKQEFMAFWRDGR